MCFGGSQPQAPQIVYQGPSEADIAANQAALDQYRAQIGQQQAAFQTQLQQQIDAANKQTTDLQKRFDQEAAAATSSAAAQQTSAYTVTATETDPPEAAQTTAAVTKKKNPQSNLRISTAALPSAQGTGLNIGV